MNFNNQIELELYFADHFDTILFPVLADMYFEQNDLRRGRKVCDIGLKHHSNDPSGLYVLAKIEKEEGDLKKAEKLLERVLLYAHDHLAAAETLCEIQTVLGRATNRLLRSWKHVQELDPSHETAQHFIDKVDGQDKQSKPKATSKHAVDEDKKISKQKIESHQKDVPPSDTGVHELSEPLKVSSRLATFTLVSVLKNQGLFSQALEVLDALEAKGESQESISLERDTIQTLIERSKRD